MADLRGMLGVVRKVNLVGLPASERPKFAKIENSSRRLR
jgi:hypothetical protein